jgi:hypothetical protein
MEAPLDAHSAVDELREALCEDFHLERERVFTARCVLAGGDEIVVDVGKPHCTPEIDRFVVSCRGRSIVATAGTLGRVRQTRRFAREHDLRAWMRATLRLVSGAQPSAAGGDALD